MTVGASASWVGLNRPYNYVLDRHWLLEQSGRATWKK